MTRGISLIFAGSPTKILRYFTDISGQMIYVLFPPDIFGKCEYQFNSLHLCLNSLISLLRSDNSNRFKYLADLDLEATLSSRSQASNIAGTKTFMAIGALRGEPYSFMHDLGSVFWVLF
ncbi:hypothetical protein N7G274_003604 [Stereocaulon virgatum]|uniref:Fungal-type protein kinase domain-containing protein n=1 Tax=Stereocaulon virgatum TaxID=373712 RepID=A0ABR4AIP4_9LECA